MTITLHMIEERIKLENGVFLFMGRVEASEEEPRFSVFLQINSESRTELQMEVCFLASNPIGIDDIIIGTATVYGVCLAGKLSRKSAKEAIKCYRKSKQDNPNQPILGHAKDAAACLAGKGGMMKDAATDALVDCLKLPKDDDDDDDDS